VPLLAGIAALVVFREVSLRVLPALPGLVALGLFAVAEPLVYWATEVKQYSLDVLAAVVLLAVAADPLLTGRLTRRRAAALALVGAIAVFLSYAALFVLTGIAVALVLAPLAARRRPSTNAVGVVAAWLVASTAGLLVIALTTDEIRAALALGSGESETSFAIARDVWRAVGDPGPFAHSTTGLVVLLAAVGVAYLARRRLALAVALAATILAAAAAAQLHLYPFFGRFVIFLIPLVLLLVGAGVQALREATGGRSRAVWMGAIVVLALYPFGLAATNLVDPPKLQETKDVLRPLEASWRPGDSLFVAEVSQPALSYYAECDECGVLDGEPTEDLRRLVLSARSRESERGLRSIGRLVVGDVDHDVPLEAVASGFARLRGEPRVWVFLSAGWNHAFVDFALSCLGRRVESFESTNAVAYLYDFSGGPDRSAGCAR
jgi:hypothetical protein